jgi:hypothetical protein
MLQIQKFHPEDTLNKEGEPWLLRLPTTVQTAAHVLIPVRLTPSVSKETSMLSIPTPASTVVRVKIPAR